MDSVRCVGCHALFPEMGGPTHAYMESSAGCWAAYGQVLAREYGDPAYGACHRLTVDAYAVQHPGRPRTDCAQSVALHLISLCLVLERGQSMRMATAALRRFSRPRGRFPWLTPPPSRGRITVADVLGAADPGRHAEAVRNWAKSAWDAWEPAHAQIRHWIDAAQAQGD